ncbi:hypothetical protein GIB67_039088 [Kingdonia uniflora]|uniref:Glutathione S-transferase n=1 Tax=Kingdonia uniflora TaxID=39325 RepID=A0A7J7LKW4_9MAGN|nr:hypothetical protein GIB67_039088 [Kingdonia uniflora]
MGDANEEVILFGVWAGSPTKRVELALKIKGIPYKAIAESLVIIEYIDEQWKNARLLPDDPYERAKLRFWACFYEQKFHVSSIFKTKEEDKEKLIGELYKNITVFEESLERDFSFTGEKPFIHGETLRDIWTLYARACATTKP